MSRCTSSSDCAPQWPLCQRFLQISWFEAVPLRGDGSLHSWQLMARRSLGTLCCFVVCKLYMTKQPQTGRRGRPKWEVRETWRTREKATHTLTTTAEANNIGSFFCYNLWLAVLKSISELILVWNCRGDHREQLRWRQEGGFLCNRVGHEWSTETNVVL